MTEQSDAARQNREYYEQEAAGREDYWRKMAAPRHRVKTLCREVARTRPRVVIDLGCGNGALLAELGRHLADACLAGVDLSESQVAKNRLTMPAATWYAANLEQPISWPEEMSKRYDAIVASEVIEHLDHPRAMLDNARALANPGRGRLFLSTQSGPVGETERRVGHRRHWTAAEMAQLLRESDWIPLRVWNTGFPFHDLSKWYANLDPEQSMERFGNQAYGWSEELICAALRLAFKANSGRYGAQLFAVAIAPR